MPEILTESFCERCGTRYTFEAAIPKKRRIGQLKVLSKGLKNYVLSDDASLDEALAQARSEEQRELTGDQLDAFHQAFQFCMSCRQYTCANCWNEAEGRCLSCAPLSIAAGQLRSPLDDLLAGGGMSSPLLEADPAHNHSLNGNGNGHALLEDPQPAPLNGSAWPTIDLFRAAAAEPVADPVVEATGDPIVEPASGTIVGGPGPDGPGQAEASPDVDVAPESEPAADFWAHPFTGFAPVVESTNGHDPSAPSDDLPIAAEASIVEPDDDRIARAVSPLVETGPVELAVQPVEATQPVEAAPPSEPALTLDPVVDARADELAARTSRLLGRFRVQPAGTDSAPVDAPAAVVEAQPEPGPEPRFEPEPVIEQVPAPKPQTAWTLEPADEPEPEPEPVAAQPEPVAAQPEPVVAAQPEPRPAPVDRVEMPVWPFPSVSTPAQAPQWPAPLRPGVDLSVPAPWASGSARDAGLWIASAQEVASASSQAAVPGGIQSCVSCGLSLSATARFCRRCGSAQG